MNVRRVRVTTAADGSASYTVRAPGEIVGVLVDLGTLSTPDVTITDTLSGAEVLNVDAVDADTAYRPLALAQGTDGVDLAADAGPPAVDNVYAPVICYGTLTVAIAGGGDAKSGDIYIAFRG